MARMPRFSRLTGLSFFVTVYVLFAVMAVSAQSQEPGFFRPDGLVPSSSSDTSKTVPDQQSQLGNIPQHVSSSGVASQGNTSHSPPFSTMNAPNPIPPVSATPSAIVSPQPQQTSGYAASGPSPTQQPLRVARADTASQHGGTVQNTESAQTGGDVRKDPSPNATRIPLAKSDMKSGKSATKAPKSFWGSLATMFGSLILVLGVFLLIAWGMKKLVPAQGVSLPNSVLQSLGQFPLTSRNRLYLLRFGKKLLLVSVCGEETSLVCEVENESEVAEIMTQLKTGGHTGSLRGDSNA